jgi:hypothetical protein
MLAAVTARDDSSVDLFLLALLIANEKGTTSAALQEHFNRTLTQAKALIANPGGQVGSTSPEAIKLALKISIDPSVRDALEGVADFASLSHPAAATVLASMEQAIEESS